ncbi:MAG: protein translocase subunit SecF [Myxococcales bacterium]|nr:protein translocase subunit SecF [Myxococcales bacterium]MDH3484931.1 protein translocase subunit SecF [Myxococcales bacterium]
MEFVKPGTYIDFMKYRAPVVTFLGLLATLSLVSLFYPGPNYGIDFAGGTEIQLQFSADTSPGEVRAALGEAGYSRPDVISVEGADNEYIIRVREVSSLPEEQVGQIRESVNSILGEDVIREMKVSPGGDKITLRVSVEVNEQQLQEALEAGGARVRSVSSLAGSRDPRYEAQLVGVADELLTSLQKAFADRAPETPLRVEWVGPKAGEQLRDAAIQSLLYAIAFIMLYVAFRFDMRFAPGGVIAMFHDALITLGVYVLLQKEVNLTTVAALLTIMGYSINDTIVVYDRIRENMVRVRDKSLRELINISTSQMLSRTIITSVTTLLSVAAFFFLGTGVIQDIAFALGIGIMIGTLSSIFIAAPITELMDRRLFSRSTGS